MAVVTLSLPDDLKDTYTKFQPQNPNRAIVNQLDRFKQFSPTDRALVLTATERQELELLHKLPFESGADLVKWVKKMATFTVEGEAVTLSEYQLHRITEQAKFHGKDKGDYLKQVTANGIRQQIGG